MLYKLYVNVAGWKELDISQLKKDIINTMKEDSKKYKHYRYMIIQRTKEQDEIHRIIQNEEELISFIMEFEENERLKQMSCLELKNEITKNIKVKSLRK